MKIHYTPPRRVRLKGLIPAILFFLLTAILFALPYSASFFTVPGEGSVSPPDSIQGKKGTPYDSLYRATVIQAQTLYNTKQYKQALAEFEKAQRMKPEDKNLKEPIEKLKVLVNELKAKEQEGQKFLLSGDNYFKAKDYFNAKSAYQQAIDLNPDDKVAKDKMKQTMDIIRSQKAQNILYDVTVANAEKMFQAKDYVKAKAEFEKASKILPDDKYAKERINAIIKIMVDAQAATENYNKSIAAADKYFATKVYQSALTEYQKAASYKPEENYPKERIVEVTGIIKALKAKDEAYKKSIAAADLLFQNATYPESKKEYQNALTIKPDEVYPQSRIKQIDEIVAGKNKADSEYERLVNAADSLYIEKKFIGAKANYQQALKIKPSESYPKEMIAKTDNQALNQEANQKAIDEAYVAAVAAGDKLFAEKSYERAKTEYQNALSIKAGEKYPKDKIAEIDLQLASLERQRSLDDQYNTLIASAEKSFVEKSYEAARSEFDKASKLKPAEKYPKDQIAEITRIIAENSQAKSKEEQYTRAIGIADKLFTDKNYEESKSQYQAALSLKPQETYPKEKIAELDKLLAIVAAEKAIDDQYNQAIKDADQLLTAKKYAEAKTEYSKALTIKPKEEYPQKRIVEIDTYFAGLADQKAREAKYSQFIMDGDKLLAEKNYEQAKAEYQRASDLKPEDAYPKSKMTEIDRLLNTLAEQKSLEEQYTTLVSQADQQFSEKAYTEAKTKYQAALKIKPAESYPKEKSIEIDRVLADMAKKKQLDDQYNATVQKADQLFAEKSFATAKTEYTKASQLKPEETYPKDRIAEIDKMLNAAAELKASNEKYQALVANADKLLAVKNYDQARTEYANALLIKPEEGYPKSKIAEIDKVMGDIAVAKAKEEQYKTTLEKADKLLAEKSYEESKGLYSQALGIKPGEAYPTGKISEIDKALAEIARLKALDEQYTTLVASGDQKLGAKDYLEAKKQYQAALLLKANEQYPKDKIAEADKALAEMARLKALDDQYAATIKSADDLFAAKNLETAKTEYLKAGALKPTESYPKEKVSEIEKLFAEAAAIKALNEKYQGIVTNADKLLAAKSYDLAKAEYGKALEVKPNEQYPKDKIGEIEKALIAIAEAKARDEQYAVSVKKADKLLESKSYDEALAEYKAAGLIKPEENYPKVKTAEIDKLLADAAKQKELELARIKAIDDQYNTKIAEADKLFGEKTYEQAKVAYVAAGKVKPAEKYPVEKAAEIDKLLLAIAKQKSIDDQYKAAIAKADKFLADKSYDLAKNAYIDAGTIKSEEQYPKDKITEIESIVAEIRAKDEAYKAAIAKADELLFKKSYEEARSEYQNASEIKPNEQYPKGKMTEINELLMTLKGKKQTFDDLVKNADDSYSKKDYYKSKELFQQASGIFPEETYPKQRLTRLNSMIDSIYRANKGLYDKAVAEGDKYFNTLIYDKAIDAYSEAVNYLPNERYPKEMIGKIKRAISENALVDVLKSTLIVSSDEQKQLTFEPTNSASRKNNYLYIKIKNLSGKPINVLVRYGKDQTTSGGAVIRNLPADGTTYDRLISVRDQDPWYRVDNNWIGLLPQGGDIEVSFIQISRATQ